MGAFLSQLTTWNMGPVLAEMQRCLHARRNARALRAADTSDTGRAATDTSDAGRAVCTETSLRLTSYDDRSEAFLPPFRKRDKRELPPRTHDELVLALKHNGVVTANATGNAAIELGWKTSQTNNKAMNQRLRDTVEWITGGEVGPPPATPANGLWESYRSSRTKPQIAADEQGRRGIRFASKRARELANSYGVAIPEGPEAKLDAARRHAIVQACEARKRTMVGMPASAAECLKFPGISDDGLQELGARVQFQTDEKLAEIKELKKKMCPMHAVSIDWQPATTPALRKAIFDKGVPDVGFWTVRGVWRDKDNKPHFREVQLFVHDVTAGVNSSMFVAVDQKLATLVDHGPQYGGKTKQGGLERCGQSYLWGPAAGNHTLVARKIGPPVSLHVLQFRMEGSSENWKEKAMICRYQLDSNGIISGIATTSDVPVLPVAADGMNGKIFKTRLTTTVGTGANVRTVVMDPADTSCCVGHYGLNSGPADGDGEEYIGCPHVSYRASMLCVCSWHVLCVSEHGATSNCVCVVCAVQKVDALFEDPQSNLHRMFVGGHPTIPMAGKYAGLKITELIRMLVVDAYRSGRAPPIIQRTFELALKDVMAEDAEVAAKYTEEQQSSNPEKRQRVSRAGSADAASRPAAAADVPLAVGWFFDEEDRAFDEAGAEGFNGPEAEDD
jgi:hypothetical protein